MGFTCGIIGLPNVGKSTLFNAITSAGAEASNYPFCTINPNVGVAAVPDGRLEILERAYRPARVVPSTIEFVDIAGLVRGAGKGEGLGNQFLSHIREVDAVAHVVRCFDDPNVTHVDGSIDPKRDIEVVEAELIFKDLETLEKRLQEAEKHSRAGEKRGREEKDLLLRLREHLLRGRLARSVNLLPGEESGPLRELHLLTGKPVMYVCNVHEKEVSAGSSRVAAVREIAAREGASVAVICAALEAEIAELPAAERREFLKGLGLQESGLDKVVREGYALLGLVTFFTVGPKEVHAWTVPRDTRAPRAAGVVHSDFERGFIRAEVMKSGDFEKLGSEQAIREHGLLHLEGKEYHIEDGDIVHFRFNV